MEKLVQVSRTLKVLKIKGCPKLTNEGIANALAKLSNLTHLDTRLNTQVDNALLETALSLTYRPIYLICYDTGVDMQKFVYDHEGTRRTELSERDCFLYECGNLKVEAFVPKKPKNFQEELEIWCDNGLCYIGSPLGSEDEEDTGSGHFYANYAPGHVDIDDDEAEEEDDFDDFINNDETEMLNELDTRDRLPHL